MATLRKITLNWEIRTGAITCDTGYIKRQELCDVDLYVTVDGTPYALDTSWALNLSVKPALLGDNAALVAVTTWTASATTGLYQATAQTIGGTALDTYLAANNADTTDDEGNKLVDLDVYYTVSMAMKAKSDTVTVICKPDVGRADDTVPAAIVARNDFLVTNGTGLLVNVAAGYAANGAFVAAQASLAITNATNYIEVTAAGVASVNTTAFTAGSYPLATVVASAGAITANTDLRAWITPKPGAAGGITSITGTANEITVTGTTTPTLSLPSALTFTGKTVTGGTFVLPQVGYLAATFDYFGEWMTFISSTDAATWKRTHTTPIVTTEGTIRDPALHYVAATGTFYVAYTRNAFTGGNSWGLGSSTDGRTWTWSTISTGSLATGTPAYVWIGDWFTDSDGTDHVLFAANTTASQAAGGLYLYETHPTTPGDYSAWSTPVQITGSAITNNLGNSPAVIKVGSTYHLFYDLPSAGGIRHVTSSSLTSGYNTAGTYPSFPSATEGPSIITLANGTYRLYAEQSYQQSTAGLKYSDSTDLVTWGSVQSAVTQGYMGHPHAIQVTSQALLNKVSMLEQGQKNPIWSTTRSGNTAVAIGYPDINTESALGPYGEGLTLFGGASGGSFIYISTRNANGAAIFTDPNSDSPASNNFYIARRSGLNYMRFDGGSNNVSFYGTATFFGSTSGSATISVSATGGLLALPSGTTATNMTLTTPDLGTPSAIVLTNATGTVGSGLTIPLGTVTLTGSLPDARNTVSNTTTTSMANLATVGTLTGGATGAGFTVALSTSTITGTLADARLSANVPLKDAANTFTAENINSKSGAASVTAMKFSGVPFAGTGTTSFPLVYINDANATASTTLNTAGTYFGVNGDGTQDLMDLMKDGVSACKVNYLGTITLATTSAGVSFGGSVLRRGSQSAGVGIYTSANFFVDGSFFIGAGNGASVRMVQSGNGILTITEEDGSGMTRVNLGGATSSFPALQVTTGTQTITAGLADGTAGGAFVASGTLAVTGATTLTGNLTSNGALISTPQALTGAGAVNVTTLTTAVTTTAPAQALTLADGTNGQIKTIVHQALSGGGTWVLTPTTKTGYTTITSIAVGETCTLQFFTTIGWCILSLRGAIAA